MDGDIVPQWMLTHDNMSLLIFRHLNSWSPVGSTICEVYESSLVGGSVSPEAGFLNLKAPLKFLVCSLFFVLLVQDVSSQVLPQPLCLLPAVSTPPSRTLTLWTLKCK